MSKSKIYLFLEIIFLILVFVGIILYNRALIDFSLEFLAIFGLLYLFSKNTNKTK